MSESEPVSYDLVVGVFRRIEKEIHDQSAFYGTRIWLDKSKDGYCSIIWKRENNCTEENLRNLFASQLDSIGLMISSSSTFHAMMGSPYYTEFDGIATRACFIIKKDGELAQFGKEDKTIPIQKI